MILQYGVSSQHMCCSIRQRVWSYSAAAASFCCKNSWCHQGPGADAALMHHVGRVQVSSCLVVKCTGCRFALQHPGASKTLFITVSGAPAPYAVSLIQTREILDVTAGGDLLLKGPLTGVVQSIVELRCVCSLFKKPNWWQEFLLDWIIWGFARFSWGGKSPGWPSFLSFDNSYFLLWCRDWNPNGTTNTDSSSSSFSAL